MPSLEFYCCTGTSSVFMHCSTLSPAIVAERNHDRYLIHFVCKDLLLLLFPLLNCDEACFLNTQSRYVSPEILLERLLRNSRVYDQLKHAETPGWLALIYCMFFPHHITLPLLPSSSNCLLREPALSFFFFDVVLKPLRSDAIPLS